MHFQIVMGIRLNTPLENEDASPSRPWFRRNTKGNEKIVGYVKTFGVNAPHCLEAIRMASELIVSSPDKTLAGQIDTIEAQAIDPTKWPREIIQQCSAEMQNRGVYYESGIIFYSQGSEGST